MFASRTIFVKLVGKGISPLHKPEPFTIELRPEVIYLVVIVPHIYVILADLDKSERAASPEITGG